MKSSQIEVFKIDVFKNRWLQKLKSSATEVFKNWNIQNSKSSKFKAEYFKTWGLQKLKSWKTKLVKV